MNYIPNLTRRQGDPKILQSGPSSLQPADRLARNLGWLSIGLGLTEMFAPGLIARSIGLRGQPPRVRKFGAREILSGVLTLSVDKQVGLWSRVAGDVLDMATVLPAIRRGNPKRGRAFLALLALGGVALLDAAAAQAVTATHARGRGSRRSYRDRSGFPKGIEATRQLARNADRAPISR
jgi:hypothetical protein